MTADRDGPSRIGREVLLWALAAAFVLVLIVTYLAFNHTSRGQAVEAAALAGRAVEPQGLVADAWTILDLITVASLAGFTAVAIGVAILRRRLMLALVTGAVLLGANMTTEVLKRVALTRPDLENPGAFLHNSFPSGHATVAMSVAAAMMLVVPSRFRAAAAVLGGSYAAVIGVAVVSVGWHRPSDAIGAFCVAGFWMAFGLAVLARLGRLPIRRHVRLSVRVVGIVFGCVALVLTTVGVIGLLAGEAWFVDGVFDSSRRAVAFVTSSAGVGAAALLTVDAWLFATRGAAIGARRTTG